MGTEQKITVEKEKCKNCQAEVFVVAYIEEGLLIICRRCKAIFKGHNEDIPS